MSSILNLFNFGKALPADKQMIEKWKNICENTLHSVDHKKTLTLIQKELNDIIEIIKNSNFQDPNNQIIKLFSNHQIPNSLVEFAINDYPPGISDIVLDFFTLFTKPPLSSLLSFQFIISPINSLIQKSQVSNCHDVLVKSLLQYLVKNTSHIRLYISDESSPLLHQYIQHIVSDPTPMGDFLLLLILESKKDSKLLALQSFTSLISAAIDFTYRQVDRLNTNKSQVSFLQTLDYSIVSSPPELSNIFLSLFEKELITPLITNQMTNNPKKAFQSAIYLLSIFNCDAIVQKILDLFSLTIISFLRDKDDSLAFLAIRFVTIVLEHRSLQFNITVSSVVQVSLNFMEFLPNEWFDNSNLQPVRKENIARVSMSLAKYQSSGELPIWSSNESNNSNSDSEQGPSKIIGTMIDLFSNFLENSSKVNLALTEFFASIAVIWGNTPTYFALSENCENGLCSTLKKICQTLSLRLGTKSVISEISKAYHSQEDSIYKNVVIILEFLMELLTIAQAKNMLNQQ